VLQYSTSLPAEPAMQIVSTSNAAMRRVAKMRPPAALTAEPKKRLKWVEYYQEQGGNASVTCRHFDTSRPTLHRWLQRYEAYDLRSLEDRSCVPKRRRVSPLTE
jgi:transposase-like protein